MTAEFAEDVGKLLGDGSFIRDEAVDGALGKLGRGYDGAAQGLGQAPDKLGDELEAQTRNEPIEAFGIQAGEHRNGNHYGDAVERIAGLELVGQFVIDRTLAPVVGEGFLGNLVGVIDELSGIEIQQIRGAAALLFPPRVKVAAGGYLCRNALVIEIEERVFVYDEAAAAGLFFVCGGVVKRLGVGLEEGVVGVPVAGDKGIADEHIAGSGGIDAVIGHGAVGHDGHAVERGFLVRDGGGAFARPGGLGVVVLEQVCTELFHPGGIDGGDIARPEAGSFHQLGGHEEFGRLFSQGGAGEYQEAGVARALEFFGVAIAGADIG